MKIEVLKRVEIVLDGAEAKMLLAILRMAEQEASRRTRVPGEPSQLDRVMEFRGYFEEILEDETF